MRLFCHDPCLNFVYVSILDSRFNPIWPAAGARLREAGPDGPYAEEAPQGGTQGPHLFADDQVARRPRGLPPTQVFELKQDGLTHPWSGFSRVARLTEMSHGPPPPSPFGPPVRTLAKTIKRALTLLFSLSSPLFVSGLDMTHDTTEVAIPPLTFSSILHFFIFLTEIPPICRGFFFIFILICTYVLVR